MRTTEELQQAAEAAIYDLAAALDADSARGARAHAACMVALHAVRMATTIAARCTPDLEAGEAMRSFARAFGVDYV